MKIIDLTAYRAKKNAPPKETSLMLSQLIKIYDRYGDLPIWFNREDEMHDLIIDFMRCEDKPVAIVLGKE